MKNLIFILTLLIVVTRVSAQNDSVKAVNLFKYSYDVDQKEIKSEKTFEIKFDSIDVKVVKFKNKIETTNLFKTHNNNVSLKFYFKSSKLVMVVVKQFGKFSNEFWLESTFYYENEKLIYLEEEGFAQSAAMHGIAFRPKPKAELFKDYGYNNKINTEFLKIYIFELMEKIKNHR